MAFPSLTTVVLDASAALSWIFDRPSRTEVAISQQLLDFVETHRALAPAIWYPEVTNALLLAERRKIRSEADVKRFLTELIRLDLKIDNRPPSITVPATHALARSHNLSSYDASYLELAIHTGSTLATFDRKLADAARAAGIPVFADPA